MRAVFFFLIVGCISQGCSKQAASTVQSISPDGKLHVFLVEKTYPGGIDRNFEILLELNSTQSAKREVLFSSPDEGRPIGTERFVWSKDGKYLLLLGKHFFVENTRNVTSTGEMPYLLYDTQSREVKCNASQVDKYKRFSVGDLTAIEWVGEKIAR